MSDDGQKEPQSIADALAQADRVEDQEDATVQISKTELAAIRESASNPAMTPEVLREINRRRQDAPTDEDDDPTQTFDRDSLSSLLEEQSTPTEEVDPFADEALAGAVLEDARQSAQADDVDEMRDADELDEFDDIESLGEFSDAELHAVVFGDDASSTPDEPVVAEPVVNGAPEAESLDPDARPVLDDIDLLDDEEFDALEELTEDDPLDELSTPGDVVQQPVGEAPAPEPPATEQPATGLAASQGPEFLDDDLSTDFRSPLSRLLMSAALVSAVAMIAAGVLRFATSGMLAVVHPAVAGLLIAVGFLVLIGMLISSLQDRSY